MNSQRNFKKQKDNYLLAEDVYTVTMDRYREGIASMTEVLQDEMRMSEFDVLYVNGCLTHLVAFVQSVENGNAQGESHSIGAIPMVGRAGMEPMVSFVRIGREHPATRQAQGGDVTVADYCFLLLCELFL